MITQTQPRIGNDDRSRRFEWSILIAVTGLIAGALLSALHEARERAEPVLVELTIRSMQSGLRSAVGAAIMEQREAELLSFAGTNPVLWLQVPPPGYRGECAAGGGEPLSPGNWCFESVRGELIYRPYRSEALQGGTAPCSELVWRVAASADSPRAAAGLRLIAASSCRLEKR